MPPQRSFSAINLRRISPQDAWLFSGSLRSNLDVDGAYDDVALREALSLAQLGPMLAELPGGLDEPVKEKGANFSAGQAPPQPARNLASICRLERIEPPRHTSTCRFS